MFDFQQKRQIKKAIYSRISLLVLFVLVIFLGKSTYDIYMREQLSENSLARTQNDYDSLKSRELVLSENLARLKTDIGKEEELRSKFNVARPGEVVVTVIDKSGTEDSSDDKTGGFFQMITSWFR
jgi:cell division protein FtsB